MTDEDKPLDPPPVNPIVHYAICDVNTGGVISLGTAEWDKLPTPPYGTILARVDANNPPRIAVATPFVIYDTGTGEVEFEGVVPKCDLMDPNDPAMPPSKTGNPRAIMVVPERVGSPYDFKVVDGEVVFKATGKRRFP